jgi:polysaccharide export outer membrane protein
LEFVIFYAIIATCYSLVSWFRERQESPGGKSGQKSALQQGGLRNYREPSITGFEQKREDIDHDLRSICLRSITVSFEVVMKRASTLIAILSILASPIAVRTQQQQQSAPPPSPGYSQPLSVDTQGIKNYLLGPGDVLDVRVLFQSELNSMVEVDSEGNISSLPFLDTPIVAKCRNEKEVQKDIAKAYAKYLKNPQVSVRTTERKSRPPATVTGAVMQPTRVLMQRRLRLNELMAAAEGFTERASGTIQILHTEPIMCPQPGEEALAAPIEEDRVPLEIVKIADLKAGKPQANPVIRPGDFISVDEADPVYVTGSVYVPQGILLTDGLTVSRALAMVGGIKKEAKTDDVRIYRQKPGSDAQDIIRVDYAAIKKNLKPDILLKPYDIIDVPEAGLLSKGRIGATLIGAITGSLPGVITAAGSMPTRQPTRTVIR